MLIQLAFLLKLLRLRAEYAFSVSSWYRTKDHNKAVGGHYRSKHLLGLAVDVILDPPADQQAFLKHVKKLDLVYLIEDDHIHVQVPTGLLDTWSI